MRVMQVAKFEDGIGGAWKCLGRRELTVFVRVLRMFEFCAPHQHEIIRTMRLYRATYNSYYRDISYLVVVIISLRLTCAI